jgi:hypothetical protein
MKKRVRILGCELSLLSRKRTLFFIHGGSDVLFEYKILPLLLGVRTETKFAT